MAISFKYVGDLNGSGKMATMTVPMNNVKMSVGDTVKLGDSAQAGYLGIAIASKSVLGVIMGFVHPNGEPVTPQNLPASATTTTTGPTCLDLTISADGDAHAIVSVSPTAVYAAIPATAPTAGTQYIGYGADITTITSGAQTLGTLTADPDGLTCIVVPYGTSTGIDPEDATRVRVILKEQDLFNATFVT